MNADARLKRLFFALWPDAALRSSLEPRIRALQPDGVGRPQRPDQWHVTLEFLGSVAGPRIDAAVEAAACVGGAPFEISLDAVEHWRRPAVLCLVARTNPPALDEFVRRLRHELARQAFDCDLSHFIFFGCTAAHCAFQQRVSPLVITRSAEDNSQLAVGIGA